MRKTDPLRPAALVLTLAAALLPLATEAEATAPHPLKQEAVTLLEDVLPTGDRKLDRDLGKAIERIEDSLAWDLWINEEHLVVESGTEVFDAENEAARKLVRVLGIQGGDSDGDSDLDPAVEAAATAALANLVLADRMLAETALAEALVAAEMSNCDLGDGGGDSDSADSDSADSDSADSDSADSGSGSQLVDPTCDCEQAAAFIARAERRLVKAQQAIDAGDFVKAVRNYGKAWLSAQNASRSLAECPGMGPDCPCLDPAFPIFTSFVDGSADIVSCEIDEGTDLFVVFSNENFEFAGGGFDGADAFCESSDPVFWEITPQQGAICAELLLDAAEAALGIGACDPL